MMQDLPTTVYDIHHDVANQFRITVFKKLHKFLLNNDIKLNYSNEIDDSKFDSQYEHLFIFSDDDGSFKIRLFLYYPKRHTRTFKYELSSDVDYDIVPDSYQNNITYVKDISDLNSEVGDMLSELFDRFITELTKTVKLIQAINV